MTRNLSSSIHCHRARYLSSSIHCRSAASEGAGWVLTSPPPPPYISCSVYFHPYTHYIYVIPEIGETGRPFLFFCFKSNSQLANSFLPPQNDTTSQSQKAA